MEPRRTKTAGLAQYGEELLLAGPDLIEILRAVLAEGAPFRFRAKGSSMSPFIRDGDVVTVFPLSGESLNVGDVAAMVHPFTGQLLLHRVVRRSGDSYHIKGDGILEPDGVVSGADILGRVGAVERNGKRVFAGFGAGRRFIAFLSRTGVLSSFLLPLGRRIRALIKR